MVLSSLQYKQDILYLFRMKKPGILNILLIIGFVIFFFSTNARSWVMQQLISTGLLSAKITTPADNEQASFSFADAAGGTVNAADLKGKVVLINFWASWCPPCRAEMPSLNKLYQQFKSDPRIVFLFVNEDNDRNKGIQFLKEKQYEFPLFFDTGNAPMFKGTLPTTVILNKSGNVVYKYEGMAGYDNDAFIKELKGLL
jgi:thiol-disulfide isomerase/thioredoxin